MVITIDWCFIIFLKILLILIIIFSEREKNSLISEPPVVAIGSCRDEHGYVPTVGRWGCEWPSWLETEVRTWGLEERWPQDHPLPIPQWDSPKVALTLPNVEAYEGLALTIELTVQQLINAHKYNTVGNFIR